jgi:hypothetical protein
MNKEVHRHKRRLDALFKKVENIDDIEMRAEWAKYLCVLTSGYIEQSVRTILSDFADDRAHDFVSNYVSRQLDYFNNPKAGRIEEVARGFNPQWADHIRDAVEGEIKEALNSIVANRHQIAHGRDVDLSFVRMKNFYDQAIRAVDILDDICSGK